MIILLFQTFRKNVKQDDGASHIPSRHTATKNSSSLGAHRRLGQDATNITPQGC